MDTHETGILTFRDLSYLLGIFLRGDQAEKLELFYRCHIPPAFNMSDLEELLASTDHGSTASIDQRSNKGGEGKGSTPTTVEEPELAMEAADVLCSPESSGGHTPSLYIACHGGLSRSPSSSFSSYSLVYDTPLGASVSTSFSMDRLSSTKAGGGSGGGGLRKSASCQFGEMRQLAAITQIQFIQLWKTLYDVIGTTSQRTDREEEALFHSLAMTGTNFYHCRLCPYTMY